jgi:hypothetical protein
MNTIAINDLATTDALDSTGLKDTNGGWFSHWLYRPVTSFYFNPFVYTMQSSWASRGMMMDAQHNNFMRNF